MADDAGLINEVLAETSFLYGGNAAFVEDLYASWADRPGVGRAVLARLLRARLRDRADDGEARGQPSPPGPGPRTPAARPDWLSAIDGLWPAVEAKVGRPRSPSASRPGHRPTQVRAAHAGFPARHHDDPRLPHARPPGGQPRPAGHRHHAGRRLRARPGDLRLRRGRLRPADLPRLRAGAGDRHHPRDPGRSCGAPTAATSACSTCTSPIPSEKAWLQERIEGRDKEIAFTHEGKVAILKKLIETEGFERFLHKPLPRHQALRPGRRREPWSRRWSRSSSAAARWA